jgi:hypothetical protein
MRRKISGKEAVIALLNDKMVHVEGQALRWRPGPMSSLLCRAFIDNTIAGQPTAYTGTDWTMERIAMLKECEIEVDEPKQLHMVKVEIKDGKATALEDSYPVMPAKDALRWLIDHEGEELECEFRAGSVTRFRFGRMGVENAANDTSAVWVLTNLSWFMNLDNFRVPQRELPKLPDGWAWRGKGDKLKTQIQRDINAALIQEFDERPKR